VEQIFEGMPHLQAAQMQSPYLLHSLVDRMRIEKMRRNDALAVMMRLRGAGERRRTDGQSVAPGRMSMLDSYSVESIISGKSLVNDLQLNQLASDDEEDRVRVVTFRAAGSQGQFVFAYVSPYMRLINMCSSGRMLHCQGAQQPVGAHDEGSSPQCAPSQLSGGNAGKTHSQADDPAIHSILVAQLVTNQTPCIFTCLTCNNTARTRRNLDTAFYALCLTSACIFFTIA
jgi:hypothetical protein